jgi:lysophospholipase L1-like esterase
MILSTRHILYVIFICVISALLFKQCQNSNETSQEIDIVAENNFCEEADRPGQISIPDEDDLGEEDFIPHVSDVFSRQRVVLIGDSQSRGPIGRIMREDFLEQHRVSSFNILANTGWGVYRWNSQRHRTQIADSFEINHPTIVLIFLGGNDWPRHTRSDLTETIESFWNFVNATARINAGGVVPTVCWIESPTITTSPDRAPALTERMIHGRAMVFVAVEEILQDSLIRTNDLTFTSGRTRDGVHFNSFSGVAWYREVFPRIESCIRDHLMQQ